MSVPVAQDQLSAPHRKALQRAVFLLEHPSFAARLAEYAGQPVDRMLRMIPEPASRRLNRVVEAAILGSLTLAIGPIERGARRRPAPRTAALLAGLSGGLSGFFGFAALPIELPATTTLMLRAIADTARHHGEDLTRLESRLACLEVFALGGRSSRVRTDLGYYASRALLMRLAGDASALLLERGAASVTAPAVSRLIAEIGGRYGIVVSERIAASAVPLLGAVGGATVNMVFMNHFQHVAHGHFVVRRLERRYGAAVVRRHYEELLPDRLEARG
jgi:hypothetical protein